MRHAARLETCVICALLLAVGLFSFERARQLRYDFHHFYRDARYVWDHAALNPVLKADDEVAQRQLPFYLPVVPLALAPLTAGGVTSAAVLWAALQTASLAAALHEIRRRWVSSAGAFWLAVACGLPVIYEAAFFNQLSFPILALCLLAIRFVQSNKTISAAASLSVACITKLLPAMLIVWLAMQRPRGWLRTCAMTLLFAAIFALVPCYLAFGMAETHKYLAQWVEHNGGSSRAFDLLDPQIDEHFLGHANQSIRAVVARWTWPEHPFRLPRQPIELSRSASDTLAQILTVTLCAIWIALTLRVSKRPADIRRSPGGAHSELIPSANDATQQSHVDCTALSSAAIWMIGMLVFSPLMRQYYLIWAWPAVALLADQSLRSIATRTPRCAWVGLGAWLIGMAIWPMPLVRLAGAHLAMLIVVAICAGLIATAKRVTRGASV
ncbi:MAG: DUF2029 domain-containing protein [Phycisphaerales bacterium]|nr:DUF2029 domain-containing protein [Phycisphaerales bacterium]